MATTQVGGVRNLHGATIAVYAGLVVVNVLVAGAITFQGIEEDQRSRRRARMIDKLAEANRRLRETLEENAGLHAQLVTQAREAGILDERQRMAGEIHDTIAQGLTGIVTQLEAAERFDADPERRARHRELARTLARESLAEARRSVQALRPGPLDEAAHLPGAIGDLAERWTQTSGIAVRVEVTGEPRAAAARPGGRRSSAPRRRAWPTSPSTRAPPAPGSPCRTPTRSSCSTSWTTAPGSTSASATGRRGATTATGTGSPRCGSGCGRSAARWRSRAPPATAPRSAPGSPPSRRAPPADTAPTDASRIDDRLDRHGADRRGAVERADATAEPRRRPGRQEGAQPSADGPAGPPIGGPRRAGSRPAPIMDNGV